MKAGSVNDQLWQKRYKQTQMQELFRDGLSDPCAPAGNERHLPREETRPEDRHDAGSLEETVH